MIIVAWFGSIDAMIPETIRRLQDGIGLTAVIPDDHSVHHSGFRMPEDLLARGPLARWQEQPTVDCHRRINRLGPTAAPVFPGVVGPGRDDSRLLKLIDEATKLGVEVWAHVGLWGYGGDIFPDLGFQDDQGNGITGEAIYWGVPICPCNTEVRDWNADCLQYIVRNYEVKAINVDHGHYPPAASITGLFGCSCSRCEARAGELGYDFEAMKTALSDLRRRVKGLTAAKMKRAAEISLSFFDFLVNLGCDSRLLDWFRFRSQVVTERMRFLTEAVHQAVGDACPLDSHLHPPSIAFLSGQDLPQWETAVDRLSGGWGNVVGWREAQVHTFVNWARTLCKQVKGLDELAALTVVYRLFGYDHLAMPLCCDDLADGRVPTLEIMSLEITKAASQFSGDKPFLPPYRIANLTVGEISELGQVIKSAGAAGFVMPDVRDDEKLKAMRSAL